MEHLEPQFGPKANSRPCFPSGGGWKSHLAPSSNSWNFSHPRLHALALVGAFHLSVRGMNFYFLETSELLFLEALGSPAWACWAQSKLRVLFPLTGTLQLCDFDPSGSLWELFTSRTSCSVSCRSFSSLFEGDELC